MNKKILIAIVLILCAVSLLFAGKMLAPKEEIVYDQTNKTLVVKGDVKVKKAGGSSGWQKMDISTVIEKGDIVETAGGATVDIAIGSNAEKAIKLEEKSRVEFQGVNPAYLNFSKGKISVALKKLEPKSSFTIKTPTAICGARGTAWMEEVGTNSSKICVFESNVFVQGLDDSGKPNTKKHTASEGTQRTIPKDQPISEAQKISDKDLQDWQHWRKSVVFLREGKMLVDDFDREENFNNLGGAVGSWNMFYSDANQQCKDEFTASERVGGRGRGLKLTYDVDSPFSAYNGFFTNLMGVDISDYKYLVFSIKGDKKSGFTEKVNIELKNRNQTGRTTVGGITDEWKTVAIPLKQFAGINNFKDMKEFVIVFNDIGVTKKEGVMYVDDIYFAKAEPAK